MVLVLWGGGNLGSSGVVIKSFGRVVQPLTGKDRAFNACSSHNREVCAHATAHLNLPMWKPPKQVSRLSTH
eukprot:2542452-Amphidinium_carterae.1